MTGNPVADELLDQIETYHRKTAELSRRLKEHPELLPRINLGLQDLIDIQLARPRLKGDDLFKAYRKVRGLIFIGPREWEKACLGPKKENPLELEPSWCHKLKLPPPLPIEVMRKVASYCRTPEWATTPVLWLALPRIVSPKFGKIPTTLLGQNKLWGVAHDNLPGGLVRQDVFWSNWFMAADYTAKYELAHEPATKDNGWAVGYEFPDLTVRKNWPDQKVAISQRKGLESVTAARDTLMLNLVLAATDRRLRTSGYSRTSTVFGGDPLDVGSYAVGVNVFQDWHPEIASDRIAASVQGVLEL